MRRQVFSPRTEAAMNYEFEIVEHLLALGAVPILHFSEILSTFFYPIKDCYEKSEKMAYR